MRPPKNLSKHGNGKRELCWNSFEHLQRIVRKRLRVCKHLARKVTHLAETSLERPRSASLRSVLRGFAGTFPSTCRGDSERDPEFASTWQETPHSWLRFPWNGLAPLRFARFCEVKESLATFSDLLGSKETQKRSQRLPLAPQEVPNGTRRGSKRTQKGCQETPGHPPESSFSW